MMDDSFLSDWIGPVLVGLSVTSVVGLILAAATLGASRFQIIRHIVLPGAMPEILTGLRVGIGFGWTTLVAAEMVAATAGLGFMVLNAKDFLATDVVLTGILVIGGIAYGFDMIMRLLERWLVPWKGRD